MSPSIGPCDHSTVACDPARLLRTLTRLTSLELYNVSTPSGIMIIKDVPTSTPIPIVDTRRRREEDKLRARGRIPARNEAAAMTRQRLSNVRSPCAILCCLSVLRSVFDIIQGLASSSHSKGREWAEKEGQVTTGCVQELQIQTSISSFCDGYP